jgi:hypothetical protein
MATLEKRRRSGLLEVLYERELLRHQISNAHQELAQLKASVETVARRLADLETPSASNPLAKDADTSVGFTGGPPRNGTSETIREPSASMVKAWSCWW